MSKLRRVFNIAMAQIANPKISERGEK